jgi:hypothetical protein
MKYQPEVGDVDVIGVLTDLTEASDWILPSGQPFRAGMFSYAVTANGYVARAQNLHPHGGGGKYEVHVVPVGINKGDAVKVDIVQGRYSAFATNMRPL